MRRAVAGRTAQGRWRRGWAVGRRCRPAAQVDLQGDQRRVGYLPGSRGGHPRRVANGKRHAARGLGLASPPPPLPERCRRNLGAGSNSPPGHAEGRVARGSPRSHRTAPTPDPAVNALGTAKSEGVVRPTGATPIRITFGTKPAIKRRGVARMCRTALSCLVVLRGWGLGADA